MSPEVVIAVAGLLTTLCAGPLSARTAGRVARRTELQKRRLDAYLTLADVAGRLRQEAKIPGPIDHTSGLIPPDLEDAQIWQVHALVAAYGSLKIQGLYDDLLTARAKSRMAREELREARELSAPFSSDDREYRSSAREQAVLFRDELEVASTRLLDQIREDLEKG